MIPRPTGDLFQGTFAGCRHLFAGLLVGPALVPIEIPLILQPATYGKAIPPVLSNQETKRIVQQNKDNEKNNQ